MAGEVLTEEPQALEKWMRGDSELQHRLRFPACVADDPPTAVLFLQVMDFLIPAVDWTSQCCLLRGAVHDSRAGHFGAKLAP